MASLVLDPVFLRFLVFCQ